jgi:hypothetical protein
MAADFVRPTDRSDDLNAGLASLHVYLSSSIETGIQINQLHSLLAPIWPLLEGSSQTGMEVHKLARMKAPVWQPPVLRFELERHGAMKFGSSRAERQYWSVNTDSGQLTQSSHGYVQVRPRDKPLNVQPLVDEIVQAASTGATHRALVWTGSDSLTLRIGVLIPENAMPKQTLRSRRSRFRDALVDEMKAIGWDCDTRAYRFRRKSAQSL